ncbi:MAG: pyruvate, water dikinase regulatory protein [Alphaproteobacteria bacterium]|jgi:hypothetical protein|nr:pyruvate, water dikinase regulatory protein [Alphaproteobacteria bacterium]
MTVQEAGEVRVHLHLVSDSTGETVGLVARAAIAQFEGIGAIEHNWPLVRTNVQVEKVLAMVGRNPGMVLYTLVEPELEKILQEGCRKNSIPCIPVLDHVVDALSAHLGLAVDHKPGRQHELDDQYFKRIEAMQFVLVHDDGQSLFDVHLADVILVGVSRSSKTPTCVYLANRGIKAANVPIVPGHRLPNEVLDARESLVVGLTSNPDRLVQIRRNRLSLLSEDKDTDYADLESVREEINQAKKLFNARGWPVIDISRRSIEETAASIMALYRERLQLD